MPGMSTLVADIRAQALTISDDKIIVDLHDGRSLSVPLAWYPRLAHATPDERTNWRWIGDREGVHWPDLDEDISIENLVLGQASQESQESLARWLSARHQGHG
jgi:Protein of unknown function (DUF2442)